MYCVYSSAGIQGVGGGVGKNTKNLNAIFIQSDPFSSQVKVYFFIFN